MTVGAIYDKIFSAFSEVDTMIANYHTHTPLCNHAVGDMREYIEAAIESGIKKLGFSDHSPQFFDDGFVSHIRMLPSEAEGYVRSVRLLAEEYKSDIEIFVGFEAEYFPSIFDRLQAFCRDYGVDYLIMGQHTLTTERMNIWASTPREDKSILTRYVDEVLEGMLTGSFSCLCHPDVLHYTGDDEEFYLSESRRLCEGAKALGIPLEINMLGLMTSRHYPSDRFFSIAKTVGNDFIVGVDAHEPSSLTNHVDTPKLKDFLSRNGITPLEDLRQYGHVVLPSPVGEGGDEVAG